MSEKKHDVIVIGSGPGGYNAAIKAAQLGYDTAIIEKYNTLGGTCLNVGCIPSKALLDSSEHYYNAVHHFNEHGITMEDTNLDFPKMIKRKNGVVDKMSDGLQYLMKKNKITVYTGTASFKKGRTLVVKGESDTYTLHGSKVIIATGSKPVTPEAFNYDKKRIITSTEALSLPELPKKLIIIGGGIIGLELGSVFSRIGTDVTVVEYLDHLLGDMDRDCGKTLKKILKKEGIKFHLSQEVTSVKSTGDSVELIMKSRKNEEEEELSADYCLIAIGRYPFTKGLGLENTSVKTDEKGFIKTDENFGTDEEGVYAIGDVIRGPMLAHKAEEDGVAAVEIIDGQKPHVDYNLVPGVVYTWPEVASVGKTEEKLKEAGIKYNKGKIPFLALGRAVASGDTEGFAKILSDATTDEILGVHIIGARAADIIAEAVSVMEFRGSAEDIGRICHAHPTYSEVMREAGLAASGIGARLI